jgi:fatty-acyl-CoA synthase
MDYFDWIRHHARQRGRKLALVDALTDRRVDYQALDGLVDEVAALVRRRVPAFEKGMRIALLARTGIDSFVVQFACARLGAIFVPLNWRLSVRELKEVCADAEPALLLCHAEFEAQAAEATSVPRARLADGVPEGRTEAPQPVALAPAALHAEDPWCILYTSGTTGKPKGVVIPYRMVLANVLNFTIPTRITQDSVFLCAMPTFHTGGLNVYANPVLHAGGTVVTMGDFDADRALRLLDGHELGVTHFFGTPTHYQMLGETEAFEAATFPTLVNCGMGGAGLTAKLISRWLDKGVPLQPTYGMTEIGPGILTCDLHRVRGTLGTSGRQGLHMDLVIADEQGREVPAGTIGEIRVRGPVVTSGYWRNPEATAQSMHDGWFKSGDLAYMDAERFVYIVDRSKEMFISGGENVYPAEVERAILELPAVHLCGVVGIHDERWGEVGSAFVVARRGESLDAEAVARHCAGKLARYKIPKRIRMMDALPLTSSGKIDKNALRALAAQATQEAAP